MITPATMAIVRPESRYSPATFQPNRPKSMTSATSLTTGAEMRNEKVTPRGMPDSTKPIKSGTAEHEQKGVMMPSAAARTLPTPSRLPPSQARVCSALKNERSRVMAKIMPPSSRMILGTS